MKKIKIKMIKKFGILLLANSLLFGCSGKTGWFRDRSTDYVNATTTPTLSLPANLKSESFSKEYEIPES
jgi:uncharacterized lipoprotein